MKPIFLFCLCLIVAKNGISQVTPNPVNTRLEQAIENQLGSFDPNEIEFEIRESFNQKVHLNRCSASDLVRTGIVNTAQADSIVHHRMQYGPFISIYELQAVAGLDLETAAQLAYLILVDETPEPAMSFKTRLKAGKHEFLIGYGSQNPKPDAYQSNSVFRGSAAYESIRYRFEQGKSIKAGFGLEKDPGEPWGTLGDFQSFHFAYQGKGILNQCVLGDYQLNLGLGLCMGSSGYGSKTGLPLQQLSSRNGFKPYRSLGEYGFLRGAGFRLRYQKIMIDFWQSVCPLSATLGQDSTAFEGIPQSISNNGLHRTQQEINLKNNSLEILNGIHLACGLKKISMGLIGIQGKQLSKQALAQQGQSFTKYFWLQQNTKLGIYAKTNIRQLSLGAEAGMDQSGNGAFLLNAMVPFMSKADFYMVFRQYAPGFSSLHSNAFSAGSKAENERGIQLALQIQSSSRTTWYGFIDLYKNTQNAYQKAYPSQGAEAFVRYAYTLNKKANYSISFRQNKIEKNTMLNQKVLYDMGYEIRNAIQMQYSEKLSTQTQFRIHTWINFGQNRIGQKVDGSGMAIEMSWQSPKKGLNLQGRFMAFQVEDYLMRMYAPEKDLSYAYASFMAMGNGIRYYVLARYILHQNIYLEGRFAHTSIPDNEYLGSGLNQTRGHQISEFSFQIRYLFLGSGRVL